MGFLDERKVNKSLMDMFLNGGDYCSFSVFANNEFVKDCFQNSVDYFPVLCGEDPDLMGLFASISEYSKYDHKGESFNYSKEAELINDIITRVRDYKLVFEKQYKNFSLVANKKFGSGTEKKTNDRQDDLRFLNVCERIINKGYLLLYIYLILQYMIPGYMEFPDEAKDSVMYAPSSENDDEDYEANELPLFTHYPCMSDIKKTATRISPNLVGISHVARLYPYLVLNIMSDNDKANVWVKLWKNEEGVLSPFYVKVNKIRTFVVWNTKVADEILWLGVLREALKYSGLDYESMTPAELVYHCFGPKFAVSDVTQIAEDYKNHKINDEDLLKILTDWVECGYPMSAAASSEYYCILGAYKNEESGKYLVNLYNPSQDADVFTMEFSEFFNTCTGLELNKTEEIKEESALRIKGYDILSKEDLLLYEANYVSEKSCSEYIKSFRDVFLSLISTDSMYEDESKEFLDLIIAARDSVVFMVWALGCDRASCSQYLSYLRDTIEKYKESIKGCEGNKEKARLDICNVLNRILDVFATPGTEGLYPLTVIIKEFSLRFSKGLLKVLGKEFNEDEISKSSEELMNDKAFLKIVSSQNTVKLCVMNEKQTYALVMKYIASRQR